MRYVDADTARRVFFKHGYTSPEHPNTVARHILGQTRFKGERRLTAAVQRVVGAKVDGWYGPETESRIEEYLDAPRWRVDERPGNITDTRWPTRAEANQFYGQPGHNWVRMPVPYEMRLAWDPDTKLKSFFINAACRYSAEHCLEQIAKEYDAESRQALGIDLFAGCGNVRKIRGGSALSTHSWACAIDFDSIRNRLKWGSDQARLAKPDAEPFWKIWEREGWISLGRERNYDWMHVQAMQLR
jgi:hypothetical protein